MYDKPKKHGIQQWQYWKFLGIWTIVNVLAFGAFFWLMESWLGDRVDNMGEPLESVIVGMILALFLGSTQTILLYKQLNIREWVWLPLTIIGGSIGFAVATQSFEHLDSRATGDTATMMAWMVLMVSMSATQWIILRKYFHTAWLWVLANGVGSIFFVTLLQTFEDDYGYEPYLIVVTTVGQFLVMGVVLLWLLGNAPKNLKNTYKMKLS